MTEHSAGKRDWTSLVVVLYATLLGAGVRLAMPLHSPAPLNDGGLFYSMVLDIQANGFALPHYTSYNAAQIPFAYPPLALYLAAAMSSALHLPAFDLLRLLPPILSALTIPAFYLLAREMLQSQALTALAVLLFAFIPRTLDWLIMGGGITRAPGLLFALLAMRQFYLLFPARSSRAILPAILAGSLVVYTHPEAAVHAALSAIFFYLWRDRSLKGLGRAATVALGTAALTSAWWLRVLMEYGAGTLLAPFSAAGEDSAGIAARLFTLFGFKFTDEYFLSITAILGLLGLVVLLVRRRYFLPAWLAFLYLLEPRGGTLYIMIPHAMMAAVALDRLLIPALKRLEHRDEGSTAPTPGDGSLQVLLGGWAAKIVLGYVLLYGIMSATMVGLVLNQKYSLRAADLEAFAWVKANTPPSSRFVLLTGENALRDSSSEWFPAITGQRSLGTVFGYEWVNDGRFSERRKEYDQLQACANRELDCLEDWSRETGQEIDYVYIRKFVEDQPVNPALAGHLTSSSEYEKIYETEDVILFWYIGESTTSGADSS